MSSIRPISFLEAYRIGEPGDGSGEDVAQEPRLLAECPKDGDIVVGEVRSRFRFERRPGDYLISNMVGDFVTFTHDEFSRLTNLQLSAGDEPLLIFGDSMSDMFAANVPEGHVRAILAEMRKAPHHTYQSLIKAAPQLLQYLPDLPPNLWVGCNSPPDWFMGRRMSHDQQKSMLRRSLAVLREVKEKTGNIVWMSAEPISWDLTSVIDEQHPLDWIVVGAASDVCPCFVKSAST